MIEEYMKEKKRNNWIIRFAELTAGYEHDAPCHDFQDFGYSKNCVIILILNFLKLYWDLDLRYLGLVFSSYRMVALSCLVACTFQRLSFCLRILISIPVV